jgi:peptide/nickel transport system permease protein
MKRLISLILVLISSSVIAFALVRLAPGDPAVGRLGLEADEASVTALRQALALDQPLAVQYLRWLSHILTGDFGRSIQTGRPVASLLLGALGPTAILTLAALGLATLVAIPAGMAAAGRRDRPTDYGISLAAICGLSVPSFWLGILLILGCSVHMPLLPASGYVSPLTDFAGHLRHLVLPTLTLAAGLAASTLRMTRAAMLEVLGSDYIRTARAKGLADGAILRRHALPNALVPIVTLLGLQMGQLFGGVVVAETLFAWPGLGKLAVDAVFARDYPVVQGAVLFMAVLFAVINLSIDRLYALIDPRIETGAERMA